MIRWFVMFMLIVPFCLYGQQDTVMVRQDQIMIVGSEMIAPQSDTIIYVPDSVRYKVRKNPYAQSEGFYDSLKSKSYNKKFTKEIYQLFFRDTQTKINKTGQVTKSASNFREYEKRTIHSIDFVHVDLLEGHVLDTTLVSQSSMAKLTNDFHRNTRNYVLRSFLLFDEGDKLDPFLMSDSERLLRRQPFIEDVFIYVIEQKDGTVRIVVAVKDRIAYSFGGSFSSLGNFGVAVTNENILGTGKSFTAGYLYNEKKNPSSGYNFNFNSRQLFGDFTRWSLYYQDTWKRRRLGGKIKRQYVSPDVKYMGGMDLYWEQDSSWVFEGVEKDNNFHEVVVQDYWVGRNFQLPGNSRTSVVVAVRFLNNNFLQGPPVSSDSNFLFYDRSVVLASVSLARIVFSKTSYINAFGRSEDIPTGFKLTLTGGQDFNEFFSQTYAGLSIGMARFFPKNDYIAISVAGGTFFNTANNLAVLNFKLTSFTRLIPAGRYSWRVFVTGGYVQGLGWPSEEQVNLSKKTRIRDLNGDETKGRELNWLRIEPVTFTPWYLYGFRFAPYAFMEMGSVLEDRAYYLEQFYTAYGGGIRIRNESLVFNTLELRYSYIPNPGLKGKEHVIAINLSVSKIVGNVTNFRPTLVQFK